jgi:hypothetical protein
VKNINRKKLARPHYLFCFILKFSFVTMSSIGHDHQILKKLLEYESIFKHYDFETQSNHDENNKSMEMNDDDFNRDKQAHFKNLYETRRRVLERNESNKKTINAKTIAKKTKEKSTKNSPTKSKKNKKSEKKVCSVRQ